MNRLSAWLLAAALATTLPAQAATNAADADIEARPRLVHFATPALGTTTPPATISLTNSGAAPLWVGGVTLQGLQAGDYALSSDNCSARSLDPGGACSVQVTFTPQASGPRAAHLVFATDDAETPELAVFLSNAEGPLNEARRRLPPVMSALAVHNDAAGLTLDLSAAPTLTLGQAHTFTWQLTGYHADYLATVAFFRCPAAALDCGAGYADSNRVAEAVGLSPVSQTAAGWSYQGITASAFNYAHTLTLDPATFTSGDRLVVRFYQKDGLDHAAGRSSLSLLVPGNLVDAENYYDSAGRRLVFLVQ